MKTKGLFYFAHPYTVKDKDGRYVLAAEDANYALCNYRGGQLVIRGYNIISPISHFQSIHMATSELLKNHEHQLYYQLDQEVIDKCQWDGIIMAPDWEHSPGCGAERLEFLRKCLPVLFYEEIMREEIIYE